MSSNESPSPSPFLSRSMFPGGGFVTYEEVRKVPAEILESFRCRDRDIVRMLDADGKTSSGRINQAVYREKQAIAIIKHNYPFSIVEHEGTRDVLSYLNPDVKFISRNAAKSDVLKIYDREKARLKEKLAKVPGKICLTADLWTAITTEDYLCVTAHYVDDDWHLKCQLLAFHHMPPPNSGIEVTQKILSLLREWGIKDKIFSITLDNAFADGSVIDSLMNAVKGENDLLCDGEFFHVRCCAHVLNVIVQDGLNMITDALHKIRESVKYVHGSEGGMRTFLECVKTVKVDVSCGLRLDVATRWNSTYLMIESAIHYRAAFSHLKVCDQHYIYGLSDEEWARVESIYEFLKPFNDITNLFLGSSYPTSNHYFTKVWHIRRLLLKYMTCEDHLLRSMAIRMMEKFEKYWEECALVLLFGVIFDPRYKVDILSFCFSKTDRNTCHEKLNHVKVKLKQLFNEYQKNVGQKPLFASGFSSSPETRNEIHDFLEGFDAYENENVQKSELDVYLEQPRLSLKLHPELDVLGYWKEESGRYPQLAEMARDLLSVPMTTVASESTFNIGGRILNKYKSSLLPENCEALFCAKNWIEGFKSDEDENLDGLTRSLGGPHMPNKRASEASNEASNEVDI